MEPAESTGDGGAMLIRLNRVRPGARALPAVPDDASPPAVAPTAPAPAVPHPHRLPLPGAEAAPRLVERNPSLERLLASGRKRLSGAILGFLVMVILPTIAAGIYYSFFASPQYVSEFRFSVRGQDGMPTDSLSAATAVNSMAVIADNFLVADFAESRDVVDKLESEVGLRRIYGADSVDWLSRFNRGGSVESLVKYWGGKVDAHFDMSTGINSVSVRAFSRRTPTRWRWRCSGCARSSSTAFPSARVRRSYATRRIRSRAPRRSSSPCAPARRTSARG